MCCDRAERVRRTAGFTLIELLVAIAIFGVMSAVSYRALTAVLETRERLDIEQRKWRAISIAFARIEQDLGALRVRPARDNGGIAQPPLAGLQVMRNLNEGQLMFSRAGFTDEKGIPGAPTRVGYRVREGVLEQLTWAALDQAPRSEPLVTALLAGVDDLRIRYMENPNQWHDRWPAGRATTAQLDDRLAILPKAIEIELVLRSGERLRRVFVPLAGGNR